MSTISPNLQNYINSGFIEDIKGRTFNIQTLDDFAKINTKLLKPFNVYYHLCTSTHSSISLKKQKELIQDCWDFGVPMNGVPYYLDKYLPPVFSAVMHRPDLALFMLENGAYNHEVKKLIQKDAELHLAVKTLRFEKTHKKYAKDKIEILKFLHSIGELKPNELFFKGMPLLQMAPNIPTIEYLINIGADPDIKNDFGKNAIETFKTSFFPIIGAEDTIRSQREYYLVQQLLETKKLSDKNNSGTKKSTL